MNSLFRNLDVDERQATMSIKVNFQDKGCQSMEWIQAAQGAVK